MRISNGEPITDPIKQAIILNKHNEMRRLVAKGELSHYNWPTASQMYPLIWDDKLAKAANRAQRCEYVSYMN